MSVTANIQVLIKPIYRDPKDERSHALLARFTGQHAMTGDPSGGIFSVTWTFGALGSVYGPYTMFTVDIDTYITNAALAAPAYIINIAPWELSANDTGWAQAAWVSVQGALTTYTNMVARPWKDFKFMLSQSPASSSFIVQTVSPNTNGVGIYFNIAGRIWDQRFIES